MSYPDILHHAATRGFNGSCHQFWMDGLRSLRIDCSLFLDAETSAEGRSSAANLSIDFPLGSIKARVASHVHIDLVGCTPYLFVGCHVQGIRRRPIQAYGPLGGYVELDGQRYDILTKINTIGVYSAHGPERAVGCCYADARAAVRGMCRAM